MQAAVAGAGNVDVTPPAGQAYLIKDIGSDVVFVTSVPDIQVAIRDAVLADAIIQVDPTTDPGKRTRQLELYISPANFMRITNTAVGAANLSWYGERVDPNIVRSDLLTIAAGLTVDIQPPPGETWRVTEIGASTFTVAGDINPDVSVGVTDGTLVASLILDPTMVRGQDKPLDLYINSTDYLIVTDTSGAGIVVGFSAVRVQETAISSIQDVAGSGTLDIRPPATQEWCITEIAAETWVGIAPDGYPQITVSMIVGANLSDILEPLPSVRWNSKMELLIDYTHYLRIVEGSAGNNEVGILGYLKREFS